MNQLDLINCPKMKIASILHLQSNETTLLTIWRLTNYWGSSDKYERRCRAAKWFYHFLSSRAGLFPGKQTDVNHWQFLGDSLGRTQPGQPTPLTLVYRNGRSANPATTCCVSWTSVTTWVSWCFCNTNYHVIHQLRTKRSLTSRLSEQMEDSEFVIL